MPFTLVQPFMCRGKVVYFYRVKDTLTGLRGSL